MADKSPFEQLAEKLNILPKQVENAFLAASKKAIQEEGFKLRTNLQRGSQQAQYIPELFNDKPTKIKPDKWEEAKRRLLDNIYSKEYQTTVSYTYEVDWDDKKIVNEDIGVKWGIFKFKGRRKGARNYSLAPATYHDLAYILSEGRAANFAKKNIKIVQGTGFIRKAWRNAKKWKFKREKYFDQELKELKFNEDKQ